MSTSNLKCKTSIKDSLRCCGPFRFDLYGFWRLVFLRDYFADFYYLPQDCEEFIGKELPGFKEILTSSFIKITGIYRLI